MREILVVGRFDILHPGHIRLLKFAKECGDRLVVAVNADSLFSEKPKVDENHRLEIVRSIEYVDHAFLSKETAVAIIEKIKPWAVVKGKEFEGRDNPEALALSLYGGRLIFGSGEFEISSEQFFRSSLPIKSNFDYSSLRDYAVRRQIASLDLETLLNRTTALSVAVVGEVIVDEYVLGNAVGLSQEDPTIVMTPSRRQTFLGGAAITAGHIKSLGAKSVALFSVLGIDSAAKYAEKGIIDYDVSAYFFHDESRPTPLKTRYRVDNKTLLRVNEVRQHKISNHLQNEIYDGIESLIKSIDLLVFSDFNYGVLPQFLVDRICNLCANHGVKVIADSQTSSQVGDISRYREVMLMTPTEKEVRVALNNPDDGLVIISDKICQLSKPENLVITLGSEGILIHKPGADEGAWENDRLPAINKNAVDPAGAGDCFLATSGLMLSAGADIWQASYVGCIASACQVDRVGNTPLSIDLLKAALKESFQ